MENKTENSEIIEKYKLKDILASSNINFLFGSGINGKAFPQLNGFTETNILLDAKYNGNSQNFEEKLNSLQETDRHLVVDKFLEEFNDFITRIDYSHQDISDIQNLFKNIYELIDKKEDRQIESFKCNIFTLNYDDVVENILENNSYFNKVITVDKFVRTNIFDMVGFNYKYKKYIPTFIVAKLHGSVSNGALTKDSVIYPRK